MKNVPKYILSLSSIIFLILILIFSKTITLSLKNAMNICLYILIPSLFVFLIVSNLFIKTRVLDIVMKPFGFVCAKLFHIDPSLGTVLFMSLFCGYPVGARLLSDMVICGDISKNTAQRMICYSMNCGPAFLIGAVSIPLFGSVKPGFYIFLCHIISFFVVGILTGLFKKAEPVNCKSSNYTFSQALVESVNSSINTMLSITGFVLLFCGILGLLKELCFLELFSDSMKVVFIGLLEVSSGVLAADSLNFYNAFIIVTALTAFGGICVHCQIKAIVKKSEIHLSKFLFFRIVYTFISILMAMIFVKNIDLPYQVFFSSSIPINTSTSSPISAILLVFLSFCLLCSDKKSSIICNKIFLKFKRRD